MENQMKFKYESQPCVRCGGTGHYSFNQVSGTTCFKCNGSGKQLTRAGGAASKKVTAMLDELWITTVATILPGDKVWFNVSPVCLGTLMRWATVARVEQSGSTASYVENGVKVKVPYLNIIVTHKGKESGAGYTPSMTIRRWKEVPEETLNKIRKMKGVIVEEEGTCPR